MTPRLNITLASILGSLLYCQAILAGGAVGSSEIPREYGPFKLGMTVSQFRQITGIQPEPCPICIEKETFATLSSRQMQRHVANDSNTKGVDFFFLNGELFQISRTPDVNKLFVAEKELSEKLGGAGQRQDQPNGISLLKWEDEATVVTMNFNDANDEVFSVNLLDWNLSQEREWRESIMFEKTASLVR